MQPAKHLLPIIFITFTGIVFGITIGFFFAFVHDLPEIRSLESFQPSSVTRIYSSDNILLSELYVEKRDPVPINKIPDVLIKALVATEDRNFFNHSGIYLKGIVRAIIKDIRAGSFVEGASTITQQLSKTLFLTSKKTITRKIQEAFLSFQLEKRYTKHEILELYLNQVYFGSGAYGVKFAAKKYFNKNVENLNLTECALLVALLKAPSKYSPYANLQLATSRRNIVLKQMLKEGIIEAKTYETAIAEDIHLPENGTISGKAGYFVDYIKETLPDIIEPSDLYKGGFRIYTTLSYELQEYAEQAIKKGLLDLKNRMKNNNIENPEPQGALISIDVKTGRILSMTGGFDYKKSPYNRATKAMRQPGSAFKPIVFALAIERGFQQNEIIVDAPIAFKSGRKNTTWMPQNFSRNYQGEITYRKALALSKNIPAVKLIEALGPSDVAEFGRSMGIKTPLKPNLSLGLGTSEVKLLDLTSAYTVFPNKGQYIEPYGISRIEDRKGRILFQQNPLKKIVMSQEGAAIMTNMLEAVIQEGTGKKARVIKHPIGGKTGTTNECKDALFIGFSPAMATGVWVGQDKFISIGKRETGAKAALPVWIDYMQNALSTKSYEYFDIPDNVTKININPLTGKKDNSKKSVPALFKKGAEPR